MDNGFTYKNSKGIVYYLHAKNIVLKSSGHTQRIYYFAGKLNIDFEAKMPYGFTVLESQSTGLPMLKKI